MLEALATHGREKIKNGWYAPKPERDDGRMFGEPSDPQKYIFDFDFKVPSNGKLPSFEGPSNVYDEIMLYNQLREDYNWLRVDSTIAWVKEMRYTSGRGWVLNPSGAFARVLPDEPSLDGALRQRAIALAAIDNPRVRIAAVLEDKYRKRKESAVNDAGHDWTHSTDSSDVEFLPGRFPHIPYRYPVVRFGPIKVVAFDIFGTIMDREKAIEAALCSWFANSPMKSSLTMGLVVDRFVTLEAFAERKAQNIGSPTSFATLARSALIDLAQDLHLDIDERSPFFTETLKR
ncbi:hypothetical protein C8T65DRAFT_725205, partial [Cerioporus squamosus]